MEFEISRGRSKTPWTWHRWHCSPAYCSALAVLAKQPIFHGISTKKIHNHVWYVRNKQAANDAKSKRDLTDLVDNRRP